LRPDIAEVQKWMRANGLLVSDATRTAIGRWEAVTATRNTMRSFPPGPEQGKIATEYNAAESELLEAMRGDLRVAAFDNVGPRMRT
jgi:hypothetical protein